MSEGPDRVPQDVPTARSAVPARQLAIAAALGAALIALVAFVAHRQLLHYERRAIEHVPAGAELALRLDLEQVVLFDPVRRHLLPLFDRVPAGVATHEPLPSRLMRLREAGLNLSLDLREVIFARVQPGAGWVLGLGGIFGSERVLPRIEAVLRTEPGVHLRSEQAMIIFEPSGVALGQADDGVLLVASDAALLGRALAASGQHEAVGLSPYGAAAFGALGSWLRGLGSASHAAAMTSPSVLRATARLELGDPLELSAEVEHDAPVDIAAVRREIDNWLGTPTDPVNFAPQADWGGERALAARARLTQRSPTRVTLHTTWERSELDRAARSLAAWLEPRLRPARPVVR